MEEKEVKKVYPYKLAELVKSKAKLGWYIKFYVWSEIENKLIRSREYAPKFLKLASEKLSWAKEKIKEINDLLKSGAIIKQEKEFDIEVETLKTKSILDAFDFALILFKTTRRDKTLTDIKKVISLFKTYAAKYKLDLKKNITELTELEISEFYNSLVKSEKYKAERIFKFRVLFKSIFQKLTDEKIIPVNPCPKNTKPKSRNTPISKKNKAFTKEQFQKVLKECKESDYQLFVYVLTMFYTFARPKELRHIQIKDIDLNKEKITIHPEIDKTSAGKVVDIPKTLLNELKSYLGNAKHDKEHYLFGTFNKVHKNKIGINNAYYRFTKILAKVKFDDTDLTLYSVKHTGITEHYLAGIEPVNLMLQSGHKDYESFMIYLKSLGLIENKSLKEKSPNVTDFL